VLEGNVKIIAPEGFNKELVSENVFVGHAMSRRSMYQYGPILPRGPRGQVDAGLGKTTSSGNHMVIPPTDDVRNTGETRSIDGIEMMFQMAPGTEAPAEMMIYFPQFKILNTAEVATHTLHNLYTLRGAEVRDAANWWKALHLAIMTYGDKLEVVMAQHHWPTWGRERAVEFLEDQRDMYKYLHDQSLHLANEGSTMTEIAEQLKLPKGLTSKWYNHDFYGSVNHNAKAVYQRYLGWYDSNPAHLWPHPPEEAARRYVEFMGGSEAVIQKAQRTFDEGDYRWTVEVLSHVVFADPSNQEAKELEADALEQLGYQTENPTWRNEYLMGAFELRHGISNESHESISSEMIKAMPATALLDLAGIRLNGPKAAGLHLRIRWINPNVSDFVVELRNGVLLYTENKSTIECDVTVTTDQSYFVGLMGKPEELGATIEGQFMKVQGNTAKYREMLGLFDSFESPFNIVTP
jgi:alkyl sulfatase BDS1-like metallo-beta-lactamase superfamily hydrolase